MFLRHFPANLHDRNDIPDFSMRTIGAIFPLEPGMFMIPKDIRVCTAHSPRMGVPNAVVIGYS